MAQIKLLTARLDQFQDFFSFKSEIKKAYVFSQHSKFKLHFLEVNLRNSRPMEKKDIEKFMIFIANGQKRYKKEKDAFEWDEKMSLLVINM